MNQERINQIALEVAQNLPVTNSAGFLYVMGNDAVIQLCTKFLARVREEEKEDVAWMDSEQPQETQWHDGYPKHPWNTEWFIALTTELEKVVLITLPEGYPYDFKTGDGTYYKKELIKCWMQFPETEFIPPKPPAVMETK